ncbi:MAG: 3-methyl-2-oxobutanoate hydroxymethyltransferase [Candidatus Omnitrophica bacterium]|nr:3-methyl-2-oxobutanoate hydroxymethyltransferase [Candidatus Omnitrophota bacterium]MDD5671687.1 3-methyl-2-oxobutanoate hydroxymethyltransferase [Candidatus Omnitrophota bacterium]
MRLTVKAIRDKKKKREKVTVLTAYDFPTARILDEEGVDIVLVGDSVGMVLLGYESTLPVTMREILHHTKAVSRAVRHALVVADMPFGSYGHTEQALRNAGRLIREGGADAVKLEGCVKIQKQIQAIIDAGISVMGHVGMKPQTATLLGGYRVQGKDKAQADAILEEAVMLDRLGAFSIVLECVPAVLADKITRKVKCPTIGIGAGSKTDGQVLVLQDMLGFQSNVRPKFVRRYASLDKEIRKAVSNYREDILSGRFPSKEESY